MLASYDVHNIFKKNIKLFNELDPHLSNLHTMAYQYTPDWWFDNDFTVPGIYILTGGRQVGKSTSCKLLIKHCLENNKFTPDTVFYLPCDEIFDAKTLSNVLRQFIDGTDGQPYLLIIDEVTYVKDWDRVIKALADEGVFRTGTCLLTGSDTLILKEAAMRFPGRRGMAAQTDFHMYPLSFKEYVELIQPSEVHKDEALRDYFMDYLNCGGYLPAINDLARDGEVSLATRHIYQQWINGDFLKQGKNEQYLIAVLHALLTVGASQISYSALTQKISLISKETCIDYCRLLERMDILINLQAFDQNKKQGFPRKARKFHFNDPFIYSTIHHWLEQEGINNIPLEQSILVEAVVASHCHHFGQSYYFKGQGEVDVIWIKDKKVQAIEVKWTNQLRPADLKTLKQFKNGIILTKPARQGSIEDITCIPVYRFLYDYCVNNAVSALF